MDKPMNKFSQILLVSLYSFALPVFSGEVGVIFTGTVISPPSCTVSGGETIDVDFGDRVVASDIDGNNYMQNLPYQVSCSTSNASYFDLKLSINSAQVSPFDDAAVTTTLNPDDFAIKFIVKGYEDYKVNDKIAISPSSPPVISVVPIKRPGVGNKLTGGNFESFVTLQAEYE